jgi:putative sterol carrier protein
VRNADTVPHQFETVDQIITRIKEVANTKIVGEVNATYLFVVEDGNKYYIDLKNGDGAVSEGEPPQTPDVTINLTRDSMLKMFNREEATFDKFVTKSLIFFILFLQGELQPANAFMTGQVKLRGDLSKALALEKLMVANRQMHTSARAYSSAADDSPIVYENVPQVFERIETICSEEIVKQVGSIFVFDVEGVDKWYLDFKNGSGKVGKGDPDQKADVTIKMNEEVALKIFNRTFQERYSTPL